MIGLAIGAAFGLLVLATLIVAVGGPRARRQASSYDYEAGAFRKEAGR